MYLFNIIRAIIVWSLLLLIVSGCSGIEPYTPTNHREEGPESGLFSGSEGGFVLYRKGDKTTSEGQGTLKRKEAESTDQKGDN